MTGTLDEKKARLARLREERAVAKRRVGTPDYSVTFDLEAKDREIAALETEIRRLEGKRFKPVKLRLRSAWRR